MRNNMRHNIETRDNLRIQVILASLVSILLFASLKGMLIFQIIWTF